MLVFYSEVEKERNKTIKKINDINQVIKHTFDSFILNDTGVVVQSCPKIDFGYHMATTNLHENLCVPEGCLVKFSSSAIYTAIKDRKKEIRGYGISENIAHFITDKGDRIIIGQVLDSNASIETINKLNYFNEIYSTSTMNTELDEDDIEALVGKIVLTKEYKNNKMILTHKILPQIKKANSVKIKINDSLPESHTFVGVFIITQPSGLTTIHFYKFLKF